MAYITTVSHSWFITFCFSISGQSWFGFRLSLPQHSFFPQSWHEFSSNHGVLDSHLWFLASLSHISSIFMLPVASSASKSDATSGVSAAVVMALSRCLVFLFFNPFGRPWPLFGTCATYISKKNIENVIYLLESDSERFWVANCGSGSSLVCTSTELAFGGAASITTKNR